VDANSGVNCCASHGDSGRGDVIDWHTYTGPAQPEPDDHRVAVDGEHGGFGLEVPGHMWFEDGHGYQMARNKDELTRLYVENQRKLIPIAQQRGISGAVYTQITDIEHEVNGFSTYDRRVEKMDFGQVRAVNDAVVRDAARPAVSPTDPTPAHPASTGYTPPAMITTGVGNGPLVSTARGPGGAVPHSVSRRRSAVSSYVQVLGGSVSAGGGCGGLAAAKSRSGTESLSRSWLRP
jgi:hypothetical protein